MLSCLKWDRNLILLKIMLSTVVSARLIGQFGPILWGKSSDSVHFFLVRAREKIKSVLEPHIPQKNYRRGKCWLIILKPSKISFSQNYFEKLKKIHLPVSFYSTPNMSFKTVFNFFVAPTKKKCALSEVLLLIAWCDFTPALQHIKI